MTGSSWMNTFKQFGHTPHAFSHYLQHSRYLLALPRLNHRGRAQGKQAHHGTNFEPLGTTVWQAKDVVVEPILLVPHTLRPGLIHGACDPKKMIDKLFSHGFVKAVVGRQLYGDLQHVLAEQGDPRRAICLLQVAAGGQSRAAVEDADVVQPQKATFEEIVAKAVFAIYPPAEIQHQLGK